NVYMIDNDPTAVEIANENASINSVAQITTLQSNGFENLNQKDFTLILSNPPYHSDFSIAKHFIEKGFNRLCVGGRMYMVTKRRDWYEKKFTSIFGGVKTHEQDGYFVFEAIKKGITRCDKCK
ncbi:MAG: methyltransferase, partial [Clostridia bacterium]|nr:methyltransferase [Clostridia bacterium]